MPFYRSEDGQSWVHMRMSGPAPEACTAEKLAGDTERGGHMCGRPSVALCDADVGGKTCDAPMCEHHRLSVGKNLDHCPTHAKQGVLFHGEAK